MDQTSSASLLSLANRLHNLESSFGLAIMEATLRLASLTDANVFLLIDSPEGRKFCGKDYLCQAFLAGNLVFGAQDVEMKLRHGSTSLAEFRHTSTPNSTSLAEFRHTSTPNSTSHLNNSTSLPNNSPSLPEFHHSSMPNSRSHSNKLALGISRKRQSPLKAATPIKARRLSAEDEVLCESSFNNTTLSTLPNSQEFPNAPMKEEAVYEVDSDVEEIPFDFGCENVTQANHDATYEPRSTSRDAAYEPRSTSRVAVYDSECGDDPSQFYHTIPHTSEEAVISESVLEMRKDVNRFVMENPKAHAILEADQHSLTTKETSMYKVLLSLIYDTGKKFGSLYRGDKTDSSKFFYACFEEFYSYFPMFHLIQGEKITNTKLGFKCLVRQRLQKTFFRFAGLHNGYNKNEIQKARRPEILD